MLTHHHQGPTKPSQTTITGYIKNGQAILLIRPSSSPESTITGSPTQLCKALRQAIAQIEQADQPRPSNQQIQLSDIKPELPEEAKLTLLIKRFASSLPGVAALLRADLTKLSKAKPKESRAVTDLALIQPLADELIADGLLLPSAVTNIALALGVAPAGAGFYRAKAAADALLAAYSSTTTSEMQPEPEIELKRAA